LLAHVGSGVASIRFQDTARGNGPLPQFAEWLQATVHQAGGWLVYEALPTSLKTQIDPWGVAPPGMALMRGIKQTLDPHGRLSPGRFVGGI
jgi:glycolate oxidase FAD binding subunit